MNYKIIATESSSCRWRRLRTAVSVRYCVATQDSSRWQLKKFIVKHNLMMMSINTEHPNLNNDVLTIGNTILKMTRLNNCIWQNEKPITLNCIWVVWFMFKTFCENERSLWREGHPLSWPPPGLFLSIWKRSSCITDSNQIDWWQKNKKLSINFLSWNL